jgi:hypothetical protein
LCTGRGLSAASIKSTPETLTVTFEEFSLTGDFFDYKGFNIFRRFRITELETAEVPAALQHTWSGHAKSHVSEVYKELLKQREWRLRWAEKAGTGFTLPGHQEAAAEVPNGKSGKILEFRKVG